MTEITYGNGVVTNYEFDALTQRLKQVVTLDAKGALIQFFDYTYDSIGQVKSITDSVNTATQIFSYDSLNRLIEANGTNYGLKKYSYDMIGNILTKDGLTYTYGKVADKTGPHAVQSLSDGTVYKYDPNGNMISKTKGSNQTEYVYDAENRLRYAYSRKVGEARRYLISNYTYDGDGGRVKKIVYRRATLPNVDPLTAMMLGDNYAKMQESIRNQLAQAITTVYVGNLSESEAGRVTNFIYLGSQKIASVSGTDVFYYHTDHLGGLNVLTDRFGLARELTEIDPFGQTVKHQKFGAPSKTAWYYFTGKPFDDETGLYYYGARYYDPKLGRFITPDTVVQRHNDPQTLNRYSYCSNNPVNRVDMDGHKWSWRKFFGAIVGAVVTAVVTIVLTPFVGPVFAGAIGGALGGMVSAGISGGNIGQAALFGAIGGAIGGGLGAASKWSSGWGAAARFTSDGLALASVASAGMSDSWDGLAGGFLGSYLGNKFANSEQFKNWQSGRGFKSNADIQKEVMAKIRASANGDGGLGWDDVAVTTNDKGAVEWWLKESAVPGPFGQPVSEWQNGKPTEWGNLMKYTDAAGGAWSTAENTAVYGGLVVATLATAGGAAEMAGVLNTAPQSNNIIRIMSRPGRWGYRIDKPDAHKPYIHDHFWRW